MFSDANRLTALRTATIALLGLAVLLASPQLPQRDVQQLSVSVDRQEAVDVLPGRDAIAGYLWESRAGSGLRLTPPPTKDIESYY